MCSVSDDGPRPLLRYRLEATWNPISTSQALLWPFMVVKNPFVKADLAIYSHLCHYVKCGYNIKTVIANPVTYAWNPS